MRKFSVREWLVQLTPDSTPPQTKALLGLQSLDSRDLPSAVIPKCDWSTAKVAIYAAPTSGTDDRDSRPSCAPAQNGSSGKGSGGKGSRGKGSGGKGSGGKCQTKSKGSKGSGGKGSSGKGSSGKCDLWANYPRGSDDGQRPCGYGYVPRDSKGSGGKGSSGKCETKGSSGKGSKGKVSNGKGSNDKVPCPVPPAPVPCPVPPAPAPCPVPDSSNGNQRGHAQAMIKALYGVGRKGNC